MPDCAPKTFGTTWVLLGSFGAVLYPPVYRQQTDAPSSRSARNGASPPPSAAARHFVVQQAAIKLNPRSTGTKSSTIPTKTLWGSGAGLAVIETPTKNGPLVANGWPTVAIKAQTSTSRAKVTSNLPLLS